MGPGTASSIGGLDVPFNTPTITPCFIDFVTYHAIERTCCISRRLGLSSTYANDYLAPHTTGLSLKSEMGPL